MMASSKFVKVIFNQQRRTVQASRQFCAAAAPLQSTVEDAGDVPRSLALDKALKPREVVAQLDKFIVGQQEAKKAVAIALRNRWRRHQMSDEMRNEVIPKNILMIGPTGCGKTEIARRIAKLSEAPFIKVEATKFTEVGFHGKDVDQIIRDLVDIAITMTKKTIIEERKADVAAAVQEKLMSAICGVSDDSNLRQSMLELLIAGEMDSREINLTVPTKSGGEKNAGVIDLSNPSSMATEVFRFTNSGTGGSKKSEKKRMTVADARIVFEESETARLLEEYDIPSRAITSVENSGIVFIDEIDKLVSNSDYKGTDASSEGVQRDLLPLIEGSSITTKHGNVNTDFILFIASGAFHSSKPSDLLAELQGRLPIRVTLKGLSQEDLYRILTEPVTNLIRQQIEMLKSEQVILSFTDEAIKEIARVAFETNRTVENIGARRLHTVIERIVEEVSFDAPDKAGQAFVIDEDYVKKRIGDLLLKGDMRKYIL